MKVRIGKDIKAVLFDHDDTLVGTIKPKWAQHKFIAKKHYGKDLSDDEIKLHWGKPLPELVSILYGTDDIETALQHNYTKREDFPKILFKGSKDLLKKLHIAGVHTGIITATSRASFEFDLSLHNFPTDAIHYTQTADDTPHHKPDPRVFDPAIKWLRKKEVKPEEVLYVADGLHDMKAAHGAGFHFIGILTGLTSEEDFLKHNVLSFPTIADFHKEIG